MTPDDMVFSGLTYQAELLRTREVSAAELLAETLRRIERYDRGLNAFRTVLAERAAAGAAAADRRRAGGESSPLLGVPVAVKEDLAVAGQPRSQGTQAVTRVEQEDCEAVRRLRTAGAVIVGITRAPELALWPYTETVHSGPTRNPWSALHSPGGSSGGTAAAVAAGLVPVALGSDGGGSIRIPAASTGIFGMKPAPGVVPWDPLETPWHGYAALGPLARTVRDWALMTDQLRNPVNGNGYTAAASATPARLRIAVSAKPWGFGVRVSQSVLTALDETVQVLRELGHQVSWRDPDLLDPTMAFTYAPRYLRSAADAVAEMDAPELLERRTRRVAALGGLFGDRVVRASRRFGERVAARANAIFADADLVLTPVLPVPALRIGEWEGYSAIRTLLAASAHAAFTAQWNVAGNPAASVPAGLDPGGLPLAVQLIAPRQGERTLLSACAELERARPWSQLRPPGFD
jgi:amidase